MRILVVLGLILALSLSMGCTKMAGGANGPHQISPRVAANGPAASPPSSVVQGSGEANKKMANADVVQTAPTTVVAEGGDTAPTRIQSESGKATVTVPPATSGTRHFLPPFSMAEYVAPKIAAAMAAYNARIERVRAVWKIDVWLQQRGSPMQGCGEYYIQNQERTGIPGTLSVGIAEAESSSGMACYRGQWSYNAWGMISPRFYGGFGSWENGIRANFDWLMEWHSQGGTRPPQTIHDCNGYCEGNTTSQTVDDVQNCINSFDASWIK